MSQEIDLSVILREIDFTAERCHMQLVSINQTLRLLAAMLAVGEGLLPREKGLMLHALQRGQDPLEKVQFRFEEFPP